MEANRQEQEQDQPLPPYTKVTAIRDFEAEHSHDLPFSCGDQLTILEPCNVIFWYLAEDSQGRRGVIPINFVRVDSSGDDDGKRSAPPIPARSARSRPSLSPSELSTPVIPTVTPSQLRQRKISPQTMPRSTASALHTRLCHTSSLDQITGDPSSASPPPTPPKNQLPQKPPKVPPPLHPRTKPPLQTPPGNRSPGVNIQRPKAGVANRPSLPLKPPGVKGWGPHTNNRRPVPLNLPPGAKTPLNLPPGVKTPLNLPPGAKTPLNLPPGAKTQGTHANISNRPLVPLNNPPESRTQRPLPIDIDNRPPAPLPPEALVPMKKKTSPIPTSPEGVSSPKGKYTSSQEFIEKSGWFQPSVEAVLCRKASIHMPVFQTMTSGVYVFKHRFCSTKQYIGKSRNIYTGMIQMFHRLFERPENKLNPVEVELKYHSPDADEWYVRLMPVLNAEKLDLEEAKMIVQFRTVRPEGLNPSLEFYSREDWYEFATWYKEYRAREARSKEVSAEKETLI